MQKRGRGKNGKNEQRELKSTTEKGRVKVCDKVRGKGKRKSEEEAGGEEEALEEEKRRRRRRGGGGGGV